MFIHAAESRQKEAGRLICCSHWQGLPRLDSKVEVSTIQLVGYQMSKEEIWDLYCQGYMLKRLPRALLCGPKQAQEVMRDILSSLKDHLKWRSVAHSGGSGGPEPTGMYPSCHCDRAFQRERWDTLGK